MSHSPPLNGFQKSVFVLIVLIVILLGFNLHKTNKLIALQKEMDKHQRSNLYINYDLIADIVEREHVDHNEKVNRVYQGLNNGGCVIEKTVDNTAVIYP